MKPDRMFGDEQMNRSLLGAAHSAFGVVSYNQTDLKRVKLKHGLVLIHGLDLGLLWFFLIELQFNQKRKNLNL